MLNANSWDASPGCDPLFGDPADPECQDSATGSVLCSQSGENMASPPQPPAESESYDVVKWSGDFYPGLPVGPNSLGIYLNFAQCGFNHNGTCQNGQVAVCQITSVDSIGYGNTPSEAQTMALNGCSTSGPWGQLHLYTPGGGRVGKRHEHLGIADGTISHHVAEAMEKANVTKPSLRHSSKHPSAPQSAAHLLYANTRQRP
jgi:hypothetical protein